MAENELNEITIDGKQYVSVKRAAVLAEYTTDYVGQLCRGGKLEAVRMGRNWYVNEASLIEHKQTQVLAKDKQPQAEPEIEPEPASAPEPVLKREEAKIPLRASVFKHSFVLYSSDDSPLLPPLMKGISAEPVPELALAPATQPVPDPAAEPLIAKTIRNLALKNAAYGGVASAAAAKIPKRPRRRPSLPKIGNIFYGLLRPVWLASAFALAFGLIFSLNGGYASSLIVHGTQNVTASVMNMPLGKTVQTQIEPFEYSARAFNTDVNEVFTSFFPSDPKKK